MRPKRGPNHIPLPPPGTPRLMPCISADRLRYLLPWLPDRPTRGNGINPWRLISTCGYSVNLASRNFFSFQFYEFYSAITFIIFNRWIGCIIPIIHLIRIGSTNAGKRCKAGYTAIRSLRFYIVTVCVKFDDLSIPYVWSLIWNTFYFNMILNRRITKLTFGSSDAHNRNEND